MPSVHNYGQRSAPAWDQASVDILMGNEDQQWDSEIVSPLDASGSVIPVRGPSSIEAQQ